MNEVGVLSVLHFVKNKQYALELLRLDFEGWRVGGWGRRVGEAEGRGKGWDGTKIALSQNS